MTQIRKHSAGRGFSLLEVIIATAILAASAVMLMSLFSTGDRHAQRADERTIAQMLCQSKLEELLVDPSQVIPVQANVFPQYPGWVWGLEVLPTSIPGFAQFRVSVTRIPGMETGAKLDLATDIETETDVVDVTSLTLPDEPTFELVRWTKFEGDLSGFSMETTGTTGPFEASTTSGGLE